MFKVGDKVRRVSGIDDLDLPKGLEATVKETCDGGYFRHYDAAGDLRYRHSDEYELVSAAPIGPVVTETVTKTRIVPGVYGRLVVQEDCDGYISVAILRTGQTVPSEEDFRSLTAPDLDAAAAVLSELAKGLRDA